MNDNDKIKIEVLAMKEKLPRDYAVLFKYFLPKYGNPEKLQRLRSVMNLQSIDFEVIEDMEKLVKTLELVKAKLK